MSADLSLVDSQELIDELRRRSEVFACVFRPLGGKLLEEWRFSIGGDEDRVLGLLVRAQNDIMNPAPDEPEQS